MYPPNAFKRIFLPGMQLVVFFLPVLFLSWAVHAQSTVIISRSAPDTTVIRVPTTIPYGSCPSDISPNKLPNHISICGTVKTADVNVKDGVQYAQEPIEGVTVAIYLGAKYAQGISDSDAYVKKDPNSTGEIAGKIDGLYTYNISNADGRFIIAAPRSVGTNGMAFLAFFCGGVLRDLYMIDTSKDIGFMPVSLACKPTVKPTNLVSANHIPAPPSITYATRVNYTSCEDSAQKGDPGILDRDPNKIATIPLSAPGLDDSRLNAKVTQRMSGVCQAKLVNTPYGQVWKYKVTNEEPVGPPIFHQEHVTVDGLDRIIEVPETKIITSRRDLEGFTHSSLGYSFQAISSLNCGISGCYDVTAPVMGDKQQLTVTKSAVQICNTSPFTPLKCKGPAIELAEPGEWSRSYYDDDNYNVTIFKDGTKISDITQPQYSSIGQTIQEILNVFGIAFQPVDTDTPESVRQQLEEMLNPLTGAESIFTNFNTASAAFSDLSSKVERIRNNFTFDTVLLIPSLLADFGTVVSSMFSVVTQISNPVIIALFPSEVQVLVIDVLNARTDIDNSFKTFNQGVSDLFKNGIPTAEQANQFTLDMWDTLVSLSNSILRVINIIPDIQTAIINILHTLPERIQNLKDAIEALRKVGITTVSSDYFPYSSLLNYRIRGHFRWNFENRPTNDSYVNTGALGSSCLSEGETDRQNTSRQGLGFVSEWPFKACYGGVLLAQDTYSTQKALYTTTKNTDKAVKDEANDPSVARFLMPGEEVGKEINFTGTIPSSVTNLPKVGKGYWRIGIVNTVCSHGVNDYVQDGQVDYPILAIYGMEGELRAEPEYAP